MSHELVESSTLAPAQLTGKTWRIKVIEGDKQGSSAYYPKEALQEGAPLFSKGTRIFKNHPTVDDKFNIPARRIEDIIGHISEGATYDGKDLWANATFTEEWQPRIKELAEAGLIAISIRAEGELTEAAGKKSLTRFTRVKSVDVVTEAGAGGAFGSLLESAQVSASESGAESHKEKESAMDKEITEALATLKTELSAEFTNLVTEALKPFTKKDSKKEDDAEGKEDGKPDAEDKAEGEDGNGNPLKKNKKVKESASFAEIDKALTEAKLPSASRSTVFALVEAGADLEEAVKAESAKVKSILEEADTRFGGYVHDEGKSKSLEEATAGLVESLYGIKSVDGK